MAALPTDLGIPGCGPDSMPAFGGLVLRAIALAWTDPNFKAIIHANPATGQLRLPLGLLGRERAVFQVDIQLGPNGSQAELLGQQRLNVVSRQQLCLECRIGPGLGNSAQIGQAKLQQWSAGLYSGDTHREMLLFRGGSQSAQGDNSGH